MLIVHHLQRSQSERIVWLCEELQLPYQLVIHKRDPKTFRSPPELQALHPTGAAPIIQDGPITLAESGAIVEYILTLYGDGRLSLLASHPDYVHYLYFLHFANGTLQPAVLRHGPTLLRPDSARTDDADAGFARRAFAAALAVVERRVAAATWLAGETFTAADVMVVTSLTTMRGWFGFRLEGLPAIVAYLERVEGREGFRRAREKGDEVGRLKELVVVGQKGMTSRATGRGYRPITEVVKLLFEEAEVS